MRYVGWFRDNSPAGTPHALIDIGKHLLGYLDNQRKLSGVQSLSTSHKLPDGSEVFAAFHMGIPVIDVVPAPPPTPTDEPPTMEGFVVRPATEDSTSSNDPDNAVLLDPLQNWTPYFYQKSDFPESPDFPCKVQKFDSTGQPLFGNGLLYFGNVDWRNKDENLICSWWGPLARYFGSSSPSRYLFAHGQVLLDVTTFPAGFFGDTSVYLTSYGGQDGAVVGACLTNIKDFGACALIVVRFGARNGGTPRKEFLVRVQVVSDDPRGPQSPVARSAWFKLRPASGDIPAGNPEILWSQDVTLRDEAHPWFFNQSCTEARTLRYFDDADDSFANPSTQECMLKINEDGGWEYTEIEYPGGNVTETTTLTGTGKAFTMNVNFPNWLANSSFSGDTTIIEFYEASPGSAGIVGSSPGVSEVDFKDLPLTGSRITTIVADAEMLPIAVDFRDDVAVYAYGYLPSSSESNTSTNSNDWVSSSSASGPAYAESGAIVTSMSAGGTHAWTNAVSKTGLVGGIKTDWIDVQAESNRTGSSSGSCTGTYSGSYSEFYDWLDPPPPGESVGWFLSGVYFGLVIGSDTLGGAHGPDTGSIDLAASSTDTTVDQLLSILYCDLRFKWMVYEMATTTQVETQSATASVSGDQTVGFSSVPVDSTEDITSTKEYKTMLNDVELASSTLDDSSSSSGTASFGTFGTPFSQENIFPCFLGAFPDCTVSGNVAVHDLATTSSSTTSNVSPYVNPWSGLTWETNGDTVGLHSGLFQKGGYGSWQSYKKHYCFSQALPTGDGTTPNYVFKGGPKDDPEPDIKKLTNTDADSSIVRFHPIWVLPSVNY